MNLWPMLGLGIGFGLAPLFKKYVVGGVERLLGRYMPNCWLKRLLLRKVGERYGL